MVLQENKVGVLSYSIHVENESGELLEQATAINPRTMVFGTGRLLKSFETRLLGLKSGEKFEFVLSPDECFGDYREELVMDIPKAAFMINGELKAGTLEIGRTVPMMDNEGNPFDGRVISVEGDVVTMDFNHALAGKSLYTFGEVLNVREATYEELNPVASGCGCGTPNDSCCGGGGHSHDHSHDHHHHGDEEGCGVCGDNQNYQKQSNCGC
ncbi:MAG: peptidylprolyl isomerase [Bacteroidales bacterium]|nr:peptidylprolyl isomerase [Bacteroidales bacterium]MDP2235056.1 peptidylprolyl isomerase [Bacteroidales bacterium]